MDAEVAETVEHGVTAFYAGGPGEPYYQPVLECLCGWSSSRSDSWQDAGEAMDRHIADVNGNEADVG